MFISYIHVLSTAFLMGLAAAAPIGPVNMMAIRRGVVGGWRHTLACGVGSVCGDLFLFSLALLGGHYLLPDLYNSKLRIIVAATGTVVLFPVGVYFLTLAIKEPGRAFDAACKHWGESPVPARLAAEVAKAAALTIFNPIGMLYWAGVTSSWLPFAYSVLGNRASGWGILMAGTGLVTWFTALIGVVYVIPHRIGSIFFRLANGILGVILLDFATYCMVILCRNFLC